MIDETVHIELPDTILIVDGKISIFLPTFNLRITGKVRQVKGRGTADADDLIYLNHYHIDLLTSLLRNPSREAMTANDILARVKFWLSQNSTHKFQNFKENNWRRPISELFRRRILTKDQSKPPRYALDSLRAKRALENGKFNE